VVIEIIAALAESLHYAIRSGIPVTLVTLLPDMFAELWLNEDAYIDLLGCSWIKPGMQCRQLRTNST
jgi:hypothetical protein